MLALLILVELMAIHAKCFFHNVLENPHDTSVSFDTRTSLTVDIKHEQFEDIEWVIRSRKYTCHYTGN